MMDFCFVFELLETEADPKLLPILYKEIIFYILAIVPSILVIFIAA